MNNDVKDLNLQRRKQVDNFLREDGTLSTCAIDELVSLRSIYVFLTNATQIFTLDRLNSSVKEVDYAFAGYLKSSDWVNHRFDLFLKNIDFSEISSEE